MYPKIAEDSDTAFLAGIFRLLDSSVDQIAMDEQHKRAHLLRVVLIWNWCTWSLMTLLLFVQVFGVIWPTVETNADVVFGREPSLGKYKIPGANDDPFSDRSVVCKLKSHQYAPAQLFQVLEDQRKRPLSTANLTSNGIDGYRVIHRQTLEFDAATLKKYAPACNILAEKIARIIEICAMLGYTNLTTDALRIIDGEEGGSVTILPKTLPVLIMPYWDYAQAARLAIPSSDGSACVFRIGFGAMSSSGKDLSATMSGTPRRDREEKTLQWLGVTAGKWRNGWLEVAVDGSRWYSDLISDDKNKLYGTPWYDFDLDAENDWMQGKDCSLDPSPCERRILPSSWGSLLTLSITTTRVTSLAISDGARLGIFMFAAKGTFVIKSIYSLEKFVSNITLAGLSLQWLIALLTLQKRGETIGVGALANALSFKLLPILLLPRLKSTLEGFWTAGCRFEGDQIALGESWSVVYPAIGEFVLVYFSLLNTVAKLTRRRVSDALFGPTLLFFAVLHYARYEIAASGLFGIDGRVSTVVSASEVEEASLLAFMTTDLVFRINGQVVSVFAIKTAVLVLNLVPLVIGSRRVAIGVINRQAGTVAPANVSGEEHTNSVEAALAIQLNTNGGLGLSAIYLLSPSPCTGSSQAPRVVIPYELLRAGYVVVGSHPSTTRYCGSPTSPSPIVITSINSWCWLFVASLLRRHLDVSFLPRLVTFPVVSATERPARVDPEPFMCRLGDQRLQDLRVRSLSAWPME